MTQLPDTYLGLKQRRTDDVLYIKLSVVITEYEHNKGLTQKYHTEARA